MKITIYTTADCPFSKSEKDYLSAHGMAFEEKDVQQNRAYLSEMLSVSDKFAGVPFTIVVKDDGAQVKLRGFTKEEFDTALGIDPAVVSVGPKVQAPPTAPTTLTPQATPTGSSMPTTTNNTNVNNDSLKGVMDNLTSFSANKPAAPPAGGLPPTVPAASPPAGQTALSEQSSLSGALTPPPVAAMPQTPAPVQPMTPSSTPPTIPPLK